MRNANRFYRGEPLTAARLNDLVEAANRFGSGANASGDFGRRPVRSATVKNESGAVVPRFGVLEVSGFWRPAATRDEAVERFAASGIELTGTTPTGSADAFLVVATEPIPPGEFGPVASATGTAFLAEVVGANDGASLGFAAPATDGANAGKLVASASGPSRIVARSGSGVCLLTPKFEKEIKVPEIFLRPSPSLGRKTVLETPKFQSVITTERRARPFPTSRFLRCRGKTIYLRRERKSLSLKRLTARFTCLTRSVPNERSETASPTDCDVRARSALLRLATTTGNDVLRDVYDRRRRRRTVARNRYGRKSSALRRRRPGSPTDRAGRGNGCAGRNRRGTSRRLRQFAIQTRGDDAPSYRRISSRRRLGALPRRGRLVSRFSARFYSGKRRVKTRRGAGASLANLPSDVRKRRLRRRRGRALGRRRKFVVAFNANAIAEILFETLDDGDAAL